MSPAKSLCGAVFRSFAWREKMVEVSVDGRASLFWVVNGLDGVLDADQRPGRP